jgi:Ca-activated chloride channel homolog
MREGDKLLYAKEAAKAMARQLGERDLLGVVGFDVAPFVVVPLEPLRQNRSSLDAEIDRLKPGGKTYLLPAIVEARRQLERQSASRKHVIILSDGETGGSGGDYIDLVAAMKEDLKMTISAIAIGDRANIPLLKRIAQYGGGLFHHTYDPKTLPQIVLEEIREKPQPIPSAEKDFVPVPSRDSEILSGFAPRSYPAVKGFVDTELKQGAKLDLAIPGDEGAAPLLASWRFGKGRAVAFTTDLSGRWSKQWIGWEGLEQFWGRVMEWLIPPAETLPPHEVRVNPEGDRTVLDFFLYEEKQGSGRFRFSFTGQATRGEGALKRLARGRYRAELPIRAPGDYRIEIVEESAGQKIVYPPVGYTLAFDPKAELPSRTINFPLLEELARLSGGEINPEPKERVARIDLLSTARPYRTELIFLIFALLLSEFILRRFQAARRGT